MSDATIPPQDLSVFDLRSRVTANPLFGLLATVQVEHVTELSEVIEICRERLRQLEALEKLALLAITGAAPALEKRKPKRTPAAAPVSAESDDADTTWTEPPPPPGAADDELDPDDPPVSPEVRLLEKRKRIALWLNTKGNKTKQSIMTHCAVPAEQIDEVLNHEWFTVFQNGKVGTTEKGKRAFQRSAA